MYFLEFVLACGLVCLVWLVGFGDFGVLVC